MDTNNKFSVKKRLRSFGYAFRGLGLFFRTQHNAWVQALAAIFTISAGMVLKINTQDWCLLAFAIGLVFIAEIANTAFEYLVDFISPEINHKAGKIKDIAAAAPLVAAIISVIIGLLVFIPKIVQLCR